MFRFSIRVVVGVLVSLVCGPGLAAAQTPASDAPAIRRWIDLQAVQVGLRYRWVKNSAERVTGDGLQWHGLTRGRFLFDEAGRYTLNAMASSGLTYVASWADTGIGTGDFVGRFRVRHLFLSAAPVRGLELQIGGLGPNRGEVSENVSHDTDGYLVGQRVTVRPTSGRVTQVSGTIGHLGDFAQTGVIKRLDDTFDYNYGQFLLGFRINERVTASADYSYEDGHDILRQAVVIRTPATTKLLTGVRLEAYERVSDNEDWGFNAAADLRVGKLNITAGLMKVDPRYVPINGDRYGIGQRYYSIGTYPITGDVSLGWYHTKAFSNDFAVSVHHRFDVILMINPTASLKRAGIF